MAADRESGPGNMLGVQRHSDWSASTRELDLGEEGAAESVSRRHHSLSTRWQSGASLVGSLQAMSLAEQGSCLEPACAAPLLTKGTAEVARTCAPAREFGNGW